MKRMLPLTIRPGGLGMRRMMESAVMLLPQPLSPTSARASPFLDVERDAVDGFHHAPRSEEVRTKIVYFQ